MPKRPADVADLAEAMAILTRMARDGDVRAAIALAGHLRRAGDDPLQARRDELRARRERREAQQGA